MKFEVVDLGTQSYADAVRTQRGLLESVLDGDRPNTLLLVQHPPVLTLGANFHTENLLYPANFYAAKGIEIEKTDRGGDVTYHGPGQLVAYPIFNLETTEKDLHKWMRALEETVVLTLDHFGLKGQRLEVNSGVWIGQNKVCAIGIKIRRWVSMHGIALNCNVNMDPFQWIVPCGIKGHGVTSMSSELGREVEVQEVQPVLVESFHQVFGEAKIPVPAR
jgi:lipoyl(octanoyl) transferase